MRIGHIKVVAGTKSKKGSSNQSVSRENGEIVAGEKHKYVTIPTGKFMYYKNPHVRFEFEYQDSIPSEFGSHKGTRVGSVEIPVEMAVDMAVRGILETDYCLSVHEKQKLMLAIVASLAREQNAGETP